MILTHRPVPHALSQSFGSNATAGIVPKEYGTPAQRLVYLFGNYQPVGHLACDFACPSGTPIVAAAPGVVVYAGPGQNMPQTVCAKYGYIFRSPDSGNITVIDHGDGSATAYSHQSEVQVRAGQRVDGGQQIGLSGATGRVDGAHLHFEYMTLPINYSSPYYSRLDPMQQYSGSGIQVAGSTNPTSQEEDSPMSQAEVNQIQAMHDVTRQFLADLTQKQHDVTRTHLGNVTQAQHDVTRAYITDKTRETTQAQQDVTRQYLSDRIKEGAKPSDVADSVIAALGSELAGQVVTELANRLSGGK